MQGTNTDTDRRTPLYEMYFEDTNDVEALNVLLKGELSAAETYAAAMEWCEGKPFVLEMRHILAEHRQAANLLRDRIRSHGGEPVHSSGLWGSFATAVTTTVRVFGVKPLLTVLRQGEEHGIGEYQKTLNNATMSPECVTLIENDLLPRCRHHVYELERLHESLAHH
jgi:hypothetical protein